MRHNTNSEQEECLNSSFFLRFLLTSWREFFQCIKTTPPPKTCKIKSAKHLSLQVLASRRSEIERNKIGIFSFNGHWKLIRLTKCPQRLVKRPGPTPSVLHLYPRITRWFTNSRKVNTIQLIKMTYRCYRSWHIWASEMSHSGPKSRRNRICSGWGLKRNRVRKPPKGRVGKKNERVNPDARGVNRGAPKTPINHYDSCGIGTATRPGGLSCRISGGNDAHLTHTFAQRHCSPFISDITR